MRVNGSVEMFEGNPYGGPKVITTHHRDDGSVVRETWEVVDGTRWQLLQRDITGSVSSIKEAYEFIQPALKTNLY